MGMALLSRVCRGRPWPASLHAIYFNVLCHVGRLRPYTPSPGRGSPTSSTRLLRAGASFGRSKTAGRCTRALSNGHARATAPGSLGDSGRRRHCLQLARECPRPTRGGSRRAFDQLQCFCVCAHAYTTHPAPAGTLPPPQLCLLPAARARAAGPLRLCPTLGAAGAAAAARTDRNGGKYPPPASHARSIFRLRLRWFDLIYRIIAPALSFFFAGQREPVGSESLRWRQGPKLGHSGGSRQTASGAGS